jgi:glycosyltransferase involved in cell wall biosynthesis
MVLQRINALFNCKISIVRALWDQMMFPYLVRQSGAGVIFFPVQEGMLFPPVPQVVLIHDLAPLRSPKGVPLLRKLSYLTRIPFVLSRSTAIVTTSQSVKAQLLQQYRHIHENKVSVVNLGYDSIRFHTKALNSISLAKYGLKPNKYLLYLGSISRNKNIHNIIIAYSKSQCKDWQLVIAGKALDPDYKVELFQLIKNNCLEPNVAILDYVNSDDLPSLYCGASLFIFPSYYEGFGLPILEAMACGVPVITSNRYSMPEVAGDAAELVDPDNPEQIAEAIRRILTDPALWRDMAERGLQRVTLFSWHKAASQVLSVCEAAAVDNFIS